MKKRLCSIIVAFILSLSFFSGCNGKESTQRIISEDMPNYLNATGQFNFMTYSVPLPTDEQFQLFKDAGLRTMLMTGEYLGFYQGKCSTRDGVSIEVLEEFFRLADEYGIDILDASMNMDNIVQSKERLAVYSKYPNVLKGFFIGDEPGITAINDMAKYVDWVNTNYPNSIYTTTLHPSWAPVDEELNEGKGKIVNNIEEYYQYMIENILYKMDGTKILCADDYPCKRYGFDGKNFLNTLRAMSSAAISYPKVIKQMCLNCSTFREVNEAPGESARPVNEWQGAYEKEVTEMEIRMPAISSLAFGFKSFLYFMYGPFPHSDHMVIERDGLSLTKNKSPIDYVGPNEVETTEYYDYIKDFNQELISFEKCYNSFKWYGTKMIAQSGVYDTEAKMINSAFGDKLASFSRLTKLKTSGNADVLVGYFKEGKYREGYFVSNFCGYPEIKEKGQEKDKNGIYYNASSFEYNKNATVSLEFKQFNNVYLVKNGETIINKALIKHTLTQELKPGDYLFVIPY